MAASAPRGGVLGRIGHSARGTSVLASTGLFRPVGPAKLLRIHKQYQHFGLTTTLAFGASAVRYPGRTAIIDDYGEISYGALDESSTKLAHGLRELGPAGGLLKIGVLTRNHRGAVQACLAAGKLGADLILLNSGLAGKQISSVLAEQRIDIVVVDEDLTHLLRHFPSTARPVLAWHSRPVPPTENEHQQWPTVDTLIASAPATDLPLPRRSSRTVVLTSGTSGTPKGAYRPDPPSLTSLAGLLDIVPLRTADVTVLTPPLFHVLGYAMLQLGAMLGHTFVLRREFDPGRTMDDLEERQATALIASPITLQRLVELAEDTGITPGSSPLRVTLSSGSPLPASLPSRFMGVFGQVLYNLYGSTEVSWATVATPRELVHDEDTAGRPPPGTRVAVLDARDKRAATGQLGRIFVGNQMLFDGYTSSNARIAVRGGMLCTGDLGYFDIHGRLFVSGREDDMVIAGGENIFPKEVEKVLCARPDIREATALGVPDREHGQRLRAYVVPEPGSTPTPDELQTYVAENLSAMSVPREIFLITSLPRNAAGKVVQAELRPHHSGDVPAQRQVASRIRPYRRVSSRSAD